MSRSIKQMQYLASIALVLILTLTGVTMCADHNNYTETHMPFWLTNKIAGESLLFLQKDKYSRPSAQCLFAPKNIIWLRRIGGKQTFQQGKDYTIDKDGRTLTLAQGSKIPFLATEKLYAPTGTEGYHAHQRNKPDQSLLNNKRLFHDTQVEICYEHNGPKWNGYTPAYAGAILPQTLKKLTQAQTLVLSVTGDSISAGYDSTQAINMAPRQKGYPWLLAHNLQATYNCAVQLDNQAVGGWTAPQGLKYAFKAANAKPDLTIIAYGMNDVSYRNPKRFATTIKKIMAVYRLENPNVEFILVASMLSNPKWKLDSPGMFEKYRDELKKLCGPGVALADLTELCKGLLQRKKWLDFTGNGVNHPNDFGHQLYASVISGLLIQYNRKPRR